MAEPSNEPLQEALCSLGVAAYLNLNIKRVALGTHGPPEPMFYAIDGDHDFVPMPLVVRARTITADASGKVRSKPVEIASRLMMTPRSASRSSTSAVLSAKR